MYKREDFSFNSNSRGWFICTHEYPLWKYLIKDGTIKTWDEAIDAYGWYATKTLLFYFSEEKAKQFLTKWLKEQNMDLKAKREQCIADIGVLQANLAKIDEEIKNSEQIFSSGQWFKNKYGDKLMLTQVGFGLYSLVYRGGNRQTDGIRPVGKNSYIHHITWDDLAKMYFNARNELTPIKVNITEVS